MAPEVKAMLLASELRQYSADAFSSLETVPAFAIPHDCELA